MFTKGIIYQQKPNTEAFPEFAFLLNVTSYLPVQSTGALHPESNLIPCVKLIFPLPLLLRKRKPMTGLDYVSVYKGKYWEAQKTWIGDMAPFKKVLLPDYHVRSQPCYDPICDAISLRKNWQTVHL